MVKTSAVFAISFSPLNHEDFDVLSFKSSTVPFNFTEDLSNALTVKNGVFKNPSTSLDSFKSRDITSEDNLTFIFAFH